MSNDFNLLSVFDRICVINLPERKDRRSLVSLELKNVGHPEDGNRVRFIEAVRPSSSEGFPSIGARGCYLSHLSVLRQAQQEGVRNVLVLEDDVSLSPKLAGPLSELSGPLMDSAWHFAHIGHVEPSLPGGLRWEKAYPGQPLVCLHCYAVNSEAFAPLIAYLEACLKRAPGDPLGGPMHVDGAFTMFRASNPKFITLIASESLASQRSSRSDISGAKWFDRGFLQPVMGRIRELLHQWRRRCL